jgi:hypothetical protein
VFLAVTAILVARFLRTGGPAMLRMMDAVPPDGEEHEHEEAAVYTCPMHPEVRSPTPGHCPRCGMDLVPEHD